MGALGTGRQGVREVPARRRLGGQPRQLAVAQCESLLPPVLQGLVASQFLAEVRQKGGLG